MPLAGQRLLPRMIAAYGAVHWAGVDLVKMVATALGESAGYLGAYHPNVADDGVTVLSQDCGLMQINVLASQLEGPLPARLMTTSADPAMQASVAQHNVAVASALYHEPGSNDGRRRWQPWVAYTTGWATFPAWWVWHQENGKPIGPWRPTGRYIQRALVGVANYHLIVKRDLTREQAVAAAERFAAHFHVTGTLGIRGELVAWTTVPTRPDTPPANGLGPRPQPNGGA